MSSFSLLAKLTASAYLIPSVMPKRQTFLNSVTRQYHYTAKKTLIISIHAVTVEAGSNCAYFSSYSKAFKHKVNIFPLAAVICYAIHIQDYFLWFKTPSCWRLNLQKKLVYLRK